RLEKLHSLLSHIIKKYSPAVIAVEELFFAKNVKTALTVAHARGVILLTAKAGGAEVREFTPLQVKQALTGYGRADKNQIQQMVKNILKLKEVPKPDDAADALAIAICCAQTKQF
ncbi:MAG: crossover junction endodeoxyribonuclease RuvC, partial [Patescibacteria group bacterium]